MGTLYFPLNFAMRLKLLQKMKLIHFFLNQPSCFSILERLVIHKYKSHFGNFLSSRFLLSYLSPP